MRDEIQRTPKRPKVPNNHNKNVEIFAEIYIIIHTLRSVLQKGGKKWLSH